jgi:hypothetical protein
MPSPPEKRAAERQEKLDDIQALIEEGRLTVRQMTEAEREQNPPRPEKPLRKRREE